MKKDSQKVGVFSLVSVRPSEVENSGSRSKLKKVRSTSLKNFGRDRKS